MSEYVEVGLDSYAVTADGQVVIVFSDYTSFVYGSEQVLNQDCLQYDTDIVENLRKYIACYCAQVDTTFLQGKKLVYNLAEPNGNIIRIV